MEFRKITISLPKAMYEQGMSLVERGLFSNFSDLIRSGLRTEFKEVDSIAQVFDDTLYKDTKLVKGVQQSMKEAREGKGKLLKTDQEIDKYMEEL